jgi:hypothetical protein
MTNLESLKMQLQYAVEKYGENDPVTLDLNRQTNEIEQPKFSNQGPQILQFHAGFRAASAPKGRKA